MGKLKEKINEAKKNIPDYQFKFYKYVFGVLIYVIASAIVVAIVDTILQSKYGECFLLYIPLIAWGGSRVPFLVGLFIGGAKVRKRYRNDQVERLNKTYSLTKKEEEKSTIKDGRLVLDGENDFINEELLVFEEERELVIKDYIVFFFTQSVYNIANFSILFYNKQTGELAVAVDLTNELYHYLANNMDLVANKEVFKLFVEDKEEFLRILYRYKTPIKIEKAIEKRKQKITKGTN